MIFVILSHVWWKVTLQSCFCRCFYVAQTYQTAKKYKEAIALYEQVLTYTKDAIQDYKNLRNTTKYSESVNTPLCSCSTGSHSNHILEGKKLKAIRYVKFETICNF